MSHRSSWLASVPGDQVDSCESRVRISERERDCMVFSSQPFSFFPELTIWVGGIVGFFGLESEEVGVWGEGEVSEEGEKRRGRPKKVPRRKPRKRVEGIIRLARGDLRFAG